MSLYVKIKKRFKNFILNEEFHLQKGTSGLLGASGTGKSLTLKSIAGIIKPDEGEIVLNGKTLFNSKAGINISPQKRNVGYLFQNYALFPNMNVEQNIACGLYHEKNKALKKDKIAEIIKRFDLCGLEKQFPGQLSGGQEQRTALARILIGNPELLLLDEPLNALDSHLHDKVLAELKIILNSFYADSLIVTHNKDEAYTLCKHIIIIDKGKIIDAGATKKVFDKPQTVTSAIITGCKNIAMAKKMNNHTVEIPSWGICLKTKDRVKDNISAVGVRTQSFSPDNNENSYKIEVIEKIEKPFEWLLKFRYTQKQKSDAIWYSFPKVDETKTDLEGLGISPKDILLLYS